MEKVGSKAGENKKVPAKPVTPTDLTPIVPVFIMPGVSAKPSENSGGEPNDTSGSNGFIAPGVSNISGHA